METKLTTALRRLAKSKQSGFFTDSKGEQAFRIVQGYVVSKDRGQMVIRKDGVELFAFTDHSGINYEFPERVLGVSPAQQRLINKLD